MPRTISLATMAVLAGSLIGPAVADEQVKGADIELLTEVRDVAARVEKFRGGSFPSPPIAVRASRDACRRGKMQRAAAVVGADRLESRGRAWEDIGLGAVHSPLLLLGGITADLEGVAWDAASGRLLIGHDRFTDSDFFPDEAGEDDTTLLMATGVRPDEPLVVHYLTHLLQRERSGKDWLSGLSSTDRILAAAAMAEGEANLVAVRYLFTAIGLQDDVLSYGLGPEEVLDGLLVPELLRGGAGVEHDFLDFVYLEGYDRLSDVFRKGGWEAVAAMVERSRTTRDILHPERPAWKPVSLGEPEIELPDWYELADRDMLGERAIVQLISSLTGKDNLGLLAGDGWKGDALYRWEDPGSPADGVTVWRTAWESADAAADFLYCYGRALQARYGLKPEKHGKLRGCIDLPGESDRAVCINPGNVIDIAIGPAALLEPAPDRPQDAG